ncbi:MAG: ATP-dependent RecD-like DNA helicase [bacterium ADurb.Bin270]|nr:AAA family ATPase [Myxococcales bacterium]OQA61566.1 MAG: ATP-dependent RecD-like DNA helicase [bacterium ADurb.Bin270]
MDWFWIKEYLARERAAELKKWEKMKGSPIASLVAEGHVVPGSVSGNTFFAKDCNASIRFRDDDRPQLIPPCEAGTLGEALLAFKERRELVEIIASAEDNVFKLSRRGHCVNDGDALLCPGKPLEEEYDALEYVLDQCIDGALPEWTQLLAGSEERDIPVDSDSLFEKLKIMRDDDSLLELIQGPPGTGKTHLIGKFVNEWSYQGKSVLLTAFTNRAVDVMLRKAVEVATEKPAPLFRAGRDKICEELSSVRKSKEVIPYPSGVLGTTLFKCATAAVKNPADRFDVAVIDEASQVKIPSLFAVAMLAKRVVVVGDHKQLPPVIVQDEARRKEIDEYRCSAFEYLEKRRAHFMLRETFRLNRHVCEYISNRYYDGKLQSRPEKAEIAWPVGNYPEMLKPMPGICHIVVSGDRPDNSVSSTEAETVAKLISDLECTHGAWFKGYDGLDPDVMPEENKPYDTRYMISCLFRKQASLVRQAIRQLRIPHHLWHVDTVERNQGQTASVAILCVGAKSAETAGRNPSWVLDPRRWNVALSRGKYKAYIVSSANFAA